MDERYYERLLAQSLVTTSEGPATGRNQKGMTFSSLGLLLLSAFYLFAFDATNLVMFFFAGAGGVAFSLLLLFSLICLGIATDSRSQRNLWFALGLVPLTRIVSLTLPVVPQISGVFWYVVVSIPVLAGIFALVNALQYDLDDIGFNLNKPLIQLGIGLTGITFGAADYFILRPEGLTDELTMQATLLPAMILLVCTGLVEELAFRGVLQRAAGALGSQGWIFVALVYAVVQLQWGSPLHGLFALGASLFYGLMVKATGSIAGVCVSHGLLNIGLYLVFPHVF